MTATATPETPARREKGTATPTLTVPWASAVETTTAPTQQPILALTPQTTAATSQAQVTLGKVSVNKTRELVLLELFPLTCYFLPFTSYEALIP
jgi:hypothetical protein